ncbi:hypothetical protein ACWDPV_01715 [Gordonia sp. NPDC003504]
MQDPLNPQLRLKVRIVALVMYVPMTIYAIFGVIHHGGVYPWVMAICFPLAFVATLWAIWRSRMLR